MVSPAKGYRVFGNKVLRKTFGNNKGEIREEPKNCITNAL
jgi:hypothetical protein